MIIELYGNLFINMTVDSYGDIPLLENTIKKFDDVILETRHLNLTQC